jgi:hypothetical protein
MDIGIPGSQDILLVFLTISALVLIGLNIAGIITRVKIAFFIGGIACELLALIPLVIAIALRMGNRDMTDDNNFLPFVLFMSLFFIPAGMMSALIGIYGRTEEPLDPSH